MSKKIITEFYSDLSEAPGAETTTISLDGQTYTVDLTEGEKSTLVDFLTPYFEAGSKAKASSKGASKRSNPNGETAKVREWAVAEGLIEKGLRGRLSDSVREAYAKAH